MRCPLTLRNGVITGKVTLDVSKLPSLPMSRRRELPACAGIYFVLARTGRLLYIGQSQGIAARWYYFHIHMGRGRRIAWLQLGKRALLTSIETSLIIALQPPLNKTHRRSRA